MAELKVIRWTFSGDCSNCSKELFVEQRLQKIMRKLVIKLILNDKVKWYRKMCLLEKSYEERILNNKKYTFSNSYLPVLCMCGVPFPGRCPAVFYPACFAARDPRQLAEATSSLPLCRAARKDAAPFHRRWSSCRYHRSAYFALGSPQCADCYPSRAKWPSVMQFRLHPETDIHFFEIIWNLLLN